MHTVVNITDDRMICFTCNGETIQIGPHQKIDLSDACYAKLQTTTFTEGVFWMSASPDVPEDIVESVICNAPDTTPTLTDKVSICQGGELKTATVEKVLSLQKTCSGNPISATNKVLTEDTLSANTTAPVNIIPSEVQSIRQFTPGFRQKSGCHDEIYTKYSPFYLDQLNNVYAESVGIYPVSNSANDELLTIDTATLQLKRLGITDRIDVYKAGFAGNIDNSTLFVTGPGGDDVRTITISSTTRIPPYTAPAGRMWIIRGGFKVTMTGSGTSTYGAIMETERKNNGSATLNNTICPLPAKSGYQLGATSIYSIIYQPTYNISCDVRLYTPAGTVLPFVYGFNYEYFGEFVLINA